MNESILDDSRQLQWQHQLVATSEIPYANHNRLKRIWQNPLNTHSLRLNKTGYEWVSTCTTFRAFKFQTEKAITNRMLLQLDRCMLGPYYLVGRTVIYVYSEQDAIMIQLHGNNLEAYLSNLANNG